MGLYRKKPVVIQAVRWRKLGDHTAVMPYPTKSLQEGDVCHICSKGMPSHGWVDTLEGGHIVCPGDWIIEGVKGEHYPCKHDIFIETYERVE